MPPIEQARAVRAATVPAEGAKNRAAAVRLGRRTDSRPLLAALSARPCSEERLAKRVHGVAELGFALLSPLASGVLRHSRTAQVKCRLFRAAYPATQVAQVRAARSVVIERPGFAPWPRALGHASKGPGAPGRGWRSAAATRPWERSGCLSKPTPPTPTRVTVPDESERVFPTDEIIEPGAQPVTADSWRSRAHV